MKTVTLVLAVAAISTAYPKKKHDRPSSDEIHGVMEYLEGFGDDLYKPPDPKVGDAVDAWKPSDNAPNPEELGNYVEGDIVFPETHRMRNGMRAESLRWPDAKVPYIIFETVTEDQKAVVDAAIAEYHEKTCIKFVPRTDEVDYVIIKNDRSGCWSSIGRIGGPQVINLQPPGCTYKGTAFHEMMHALGFLHEQSRWERDDFVEIVFDNIIRGLESQFRKASQEDTDDFGVPYDYQSIMHYHSHAFSSNGEPTIVPKKSYVKLGQRKAASPGDLQKINRMYKCE